MPLPRLVTTATATADTADPTDSVLLAVYAPFGGDAQLSTYPDGSAVDLAQHPLLHNLLAVAKLGVHVAALIDRVDQDTVLVEIPAGHPEQMRVTSRWKQQMDRPNTLSGFLQHAHSWQPQAALVLAIEGHGAGFLPEIDRSQMTLAAITRRGQLAWRLNGRESPALPAVSPMLPAVSPMLPAVSPMLPGGAMPLSTWAMGEGLRLARAAGVPKLAVLHLNNCFNMSVELLHTVAPHARFAAGYINYNFFTAGQSYPWVFGQLRRAGQASAKQLAQWFSHGNERFLAAKGNHPTVGGVVDLRRMHEIAERLDDLADALLAALRAASGAARDAVVAKIQGSIVRAKQLDTPSGGGFELETPDEMTDLRSLAIELQVPDFSPHPVRASAAALANALDGIWQYGAHDRPWVDTSVDWDFSANDMAMNILLPDPLRSGRYDWRTPFYMNVNPDPSAPAVQPHVIELLKVTDWVDFLDEYHRGVAFVGLHAANVPVFPVYNAAFNPPQIGKATGKTDGSTAYQKPRRSAGKTAG